MGSAASTLDNSMSIYPPQSTHNTAHVQSPLGQSNGRGSINLGEGNTRGSIGLSGPLSKVDLARDTSSLKGKGKAVEDEEKEEGEISDDEIQEISPPTYPLPPRQSPVPPRGQPIDRSRGGGGAPRAPGLGRADYTSDRSDRSLSREREREWEEYRNAQRRPSEEDDRRASGSRGRRASPSYHPYAPVTQSAPAPFRPPYRPPPPSSIPLPYGHPVRPPAPVGRPPPPHIRPPHPPTAPRAQYPSPPVAFRRGPSLVPVPWPPPVPAGTAVPPLPAVQAGPGHVAAAPANISPDEAKQYMSLVRNLLQDGFTPDQLVRHGATPQYVTAVCEEIVEGQKRRKSLWMGANPAPSSSMDRPMVFPPLSAIGSAPSAHPAVSLPGISSIAPRPVPLAPQPEAELGDQTRPIVVFDSSEPTSRAPSIRSPSPQVQILRSVQMDRRASLSSEGSAERALIDSSPSPPRRLVASSHWAPPVRPTAGPSSRAIKIETYKPPSPAGEPVLPASQPSASVSSGASGNLAARPSVLGTNGKMPPSGPRSAGLYRRNSSLTAAQSVTPSVETWTEESASKRPRHLSPDRTTESSTPGSSASQASTSTIRPLQQSSSSGTIKHPLPEKPFLDLSIDDPPIAPSLLNHMMDNQPFASNSIPHPSLAVLPDLPQPPTSVTAADLASKNAVLEARRRALESMRARRKKKAFNVDGSASPMDMDIDVDTPTTAITVTADSKEGDSLAAADSMEAAIAAEKSIEDEVADLEQEVMGYQNALDRQDAERSQELSGEIVVGPPTVAKSTEEVSTSGAVQAGSGDISDMRMEIDEPEEGELPPEDPTPPLPLSLDLVPTTSTSRRSRNRPGAEDLDSPPTTAPSRARRKPFGAPQRANKLIIALDESDSDSEPDTPNDQVHRRAEILRRLAEEKQNSPLPFLGSPSIGDSGPSQKELDALAEHEEKIRALKAQIAAKMKAKEAARLAKEAGMSEGGSSRGNSLTPEEPPPTGQIQSGRESPLKHEVMLPMDRQEAVEIKQEIVEIQSVVEAAVMEVDVEDSRVPSAPPAPLPAGLSCHLRPRQMTKQSLRVSLKLDTQGPAFSPLDDRSPFAVPQAPPVVHFAPYSGILSRYPRLSSDALSGSVSGFSLAKPGSNVDLDAPVSTTGTSLLVPRREVLRGIMLTRITHQNPNASLCSAEVGGGACADPSCSSIHFDLDLDPTAEDLVEYVLQSGPDSLERSTVTRAVDLVLKMNPPTATPAQKGTPKKGKSKGRAKAGPADGAVPTTEEKLESLTLTLSKISHALGLAAR